MAFGVMVQNYGSDSQLIYMIDHEDLDIESKDESLITRELGAGNYKVIEIQKLPNEQIVHLQKL